MRVSSEGDRQTTNLQRDALLQAGVDPRHLFEDKTSGFSVIRPPSKAICTNYTICSEQEKSSEEHTWFLPSATVVANFAHAEFS